MTLLQFLTKKGFTKSKLRHTKTNHFEIKATINGVKGRFILDTGASNLCVDFNRIETFKLKTQETEVKATGVGATEMETQISKKNSLKIGKWKKNKVAIVLFDLSHVNNELVKHNIEPVDGLIGADILKKGDAVIDYKKKYLYLKL